MHPSSVSCMRRICGLATALSRRAWDVPGCVFMEDCCIAASSAKLHRTLMYEQWDCLLALNEQVMLARRLDVVEVLDGHHAGPMDPVSAAASVIGVITLAGQCCNGLMKLRRACRALPGRLHALNNEVTDTRIVLEDLLVLTKERKSLDGFRVGHDAFAVALNDLTAALTELDGIVNALLVTSRFAKVPLVQLRAWQKVHNQLQSLQNTIIAAKGQINILLGASNSHDLLRIRLAVDAISVHSAASISLQGGLRDEILHGLESRQVALVSSIDSIIDAKIARLEERMSGQEDRFYDCQEIALGPELAPVGSSQGLTYRRRSQAKLLEPKQLETRPDAVGIRLARIASQCRHGCPCCCHKQRRTAMPAMLDCVLGQLFVRYSGLPVLSPKCDDRLCEKSQAPLIDLEYWFPVGVFWSQILRIQYSYQANIGPQFQLSTLRRIPDDALAVDLALAGNIDGLKHLFTHGLASPRDVSSTRGYSLLRWALYGKQYKTCLFLLNEGADPDYRPIAAYDNSPRNKAHDYLLQGQQPADAEKAMRALTLGSTWIEDQNFTLLHKAVLGLSFTSLDDAIFQHPDDIDTVDLMGRTPLVWAAARGDVAMVGRLLAAGANPNAMDVQVSTALDYAADRGYAKCCRMLLEAGAHTDPKKAGSVKTGSALNCAARNATDPMVIKTLLDFNADIESCGVDGKTSLIHVARTNNISFALLLLEYGADLNAVSSTSQTPLTTAIIHNSHDVLQLLLDRWFEYSSCPRLKGPHLLYVVAQHANHQTMAQLTAADHLRLKYDRDFATADFSIYLKQRPDFDEKLEQAFKELMDLVLAQPAINDS